MPPSTNQKSGSRPGTAVQAKGQQRVDEILDAATAILVEEGYAQFSTRKIASRVGIRLSNVQYYFPTKQDLLQALLQRSMDRYYAALTEKLAAGPRTAKARLRYSVDYVVRSHEDPRNIRFFTELWALAAHDPEASRVMDAFYTRWCENAADLIMELSPGASRNKAMRRAALIIALVDGLSLLVGPGKVERPLLRGIENELREAVVKLATEM